MPDLASKISKRVVAYMASSPVPLTLREMEQFLLLEPGVLEEIPRVRVVINVVQYCGPLIEVVEDTLQFVHFTVKEYVI